MTKKVEVNLFEVIDTKAKYDNFRSLLKGLNDLVDTTVAGGEAGTLMEGVAALLNEVTEHFREADDAFEALCEKLCRAAEQ